MEDILHYPLFLITDLLHHSQGMFYLPSPDMFAEVGIVRSNGPKFDCMKGHGLDSPLPPRHRRDGVGFSYITSNYRQIGRVSRELQRYFFLNSDMQKESPFSSEELGLTQLKLVRKFHMGLDGHPYSPSSPFDRNFCPIYSKLCGLPLDFEKVFSDGEGILFVTFNTFVEPLGLLFMSRIQA